MNLLVIGIGIGHEKDLIIGYRYRFKFFISCIPNNNDKISLAICSLLCYLHTEWERLILKGSYDAISSFPFSLECYKLFVHRWDPWSCKD